MEIINGHRIPSEPAILTARPMSLAAAHAAGIAGVDERHRLELLVLRWRRAERIFYGVLIIPRAPEERHKAALQLLTREQIGRLRDSTEGDVLHALVAEYQADLRAGYYEGSAEQERALSQVMYALLVADRFEGVEVRLSMRNFAEKRHAR